MNKYPDIHHSLLSIYEQNVAVCCMKWSLILGGSNTLQWNLKLEQPALHSLLNHSLMCLYVTFKQSVYD